MQHYPMDRKQFSDQLYYALADIAGRNDAKTTDPMRLIMLCLELERDLRLSEEWRKAEKENEE